MSPNVVPSVSVNDGPRTPNQWFNIQAFALQAPYTFGNAGRTVVTGVPVFSIDFAAKKSFYFSERRYLQFRFEAFNFLNHPNFGDPGNGLTGNLQDANGVAIPGTGSFGRITGTKAGIDMRELQFSLKLVF